MADTVLIQQPPSGRLASTISVRRVQQGVELISIAPYSTGKPVSCAAENDFAPIRSVCSTQHSQPHRRLIKLLEPGGHVA
jgi:hypothetical protein